MGARQLPDRFVVAFSFAGEQRELVRAIATEVELRLGEPNVFFDEWWEHYLAGGDADIKLQEVYANATVAVVCVAQRYGDKPWTRAEYAAIRARLMEVQQEGDEHGKLGVLPIRVGDGDVPGIPFNTIVPDVRTRSATEAAQLIIDRLSLVGGGADRVRHPSTTGGRVHTVLPGERIEQIAARYLGSPTGWRSIATHNRILDPVSLAPGSRLDIPEAVDDDAG